MITTSMSWFLMGGAACACMTGGLAVMYAALTPGRGGEATGNPPAVRSHPSPRPGYLILDKPGTVAPWQSATHPEAWPAVPELLYSDQMAQLAAISREVDQLHAEAWRLYRR